VATSTPRTKKPTAHFDIGQAQQEYEAGLDHVEPFTVATKSKGIITLVDPRVIGWQIVASFDMANPYGMLRETTATEEDFQAFVEDDFPVKVLGQMMLAWRDHYGITEDFQGN
jgi:hypothetical protein